MVVIAIKIDEKTSRVQSVKDCPLCGRKIFIECCNYQEENEYCAIKCDCGLQFHGTKDAVATIKQWNRRV